MKRTIFLMLLVMGVGLSQASLELDSISTDPAIIAAGDEVDIVVQFHHSPALEEIDMIGNPAYEFEVRLQPDSAIAEKHAIVMDEEGDDQKGRIVGEGYYNRKFRIKINQDAVPGSYQFMLVGQWHKDGQPLEYRQKVRFDIPVKKEGISLDVGNVVSVPEKVRSGDKQVMVMASVYNTGEKAAKDVRISLSYPFGLSSSYTNDNELYVGTVEPMQEKQVKFYVDTERGMKEGSHRINYFMDYQDVDNNDYSTQGSFPFVVKKRPDITVVSSEGSGLAGEEIELKVTVKNVGEETSDAVDIRILKQSSQPFEMDVRSAYLGEIKPGETATAAFRIRSLNDAEVKDHSLSVAIRARGDSEEGDNNIYTNTGAAILSITGPQKNIYPAAGIGMLAVVLLGGLGINAYRKRRKR